MSYSSVCNNHFIGQAHARQMRVADVRVAALRAPSVRVRRTIARHALGVVAGSALARVACPMHKDTVGLGGR